MLRGAEGGREVWLQGSDVPVRDEQGLVRLVARVVIDVTETEAQLIDLEAMHRMKAVSADLSRVSGHMSERLAQLHGVGGGEAQAQAAR